MSDVVIELLRATSSVNRRYAVGHSLPPLSMSDRLVQFQAGVRTTAHELCKVFLSIMRKDEESAKCNSCVKTILRGKHLQHFEMLGSECWQDCKGTCHLLYFLKKMLQMS